MREPQTGGGRRRGMNISSSLEVRIELRAEVPIFYGGPFVFTVYMISNSGC